MPNRPLLQLMAAQIKEFFREPEILFWALLFPILIAWVLGIAFVSRDTVSRAIGLVPSATAGDAALAAWVETKATAQAAPRAADQGQDVFAFIDYPDEPAAILALKRGKILLYIQPDPQTQQRVYSFDPRNPEAQLAYLLLERQPAAPPESRTKALQAEGTRYIDFLIPGLIALGIMNSAMWGIGWGLIERRIKKLLRRMAATPMKKSDFLLSYFYTRLILSLIETLVLAGFARVYFNVRLQGSWAALALLFLCGNLAFAGIAVLTASRARNSQVGNGLLNAVTLSMMIVSGIFFSYQNFPAWAVAVVSKLPLTILADSLRQVFTEGAGVSDIAPAALALFAFGAATLALGQRWFKWY